MYITDRAVLGDAVMFSATGIALGRRDHNELLDTYPVGTPHPFPGDQLSEGDRTWVVTTIARQGGRWEAYGYELVDA